MDNTETERNFSEEKRQAKKGDRKEEKKNESIQIGDHSF